LWKNQVATFPFANLVIWARVHVANVALGARRCGSLGCSMKQSTEVLVIGDPAMDQLILRQPCSSHETEFDWQRYPRYTLWEVPGGVALSVAVLRDLGFSPATVSVRSLDRGLKTTMLKTLSRLSAAEVNGHGRCVRIVAEDKAARAVKCDGEEEAQFHLRVKSSEGYFRSQDGGEWTKHGGRRRWSGLC